MSGSKKQETQATNAPWGPQQGYLIKGFEAAGEALNKLPDTTYSGEVLAPVNQTQKDSALGLQGVGTALQNAGFGNDFLSMATATARGDYLDPTKNSALMNAIDSSNRSVSNWLNAEALPAVRDSSIASGYYGGSRQGVAQANAITEATKMAQDNANQLIMGNYNTERQNQIGAANLLSQAAQLQTLPLQLQNTAATQLQQYDQAAIDAILGKQDYDFQVPYLGLGDYMNLVNGTYGGTSTSTTPGKSGLASGLQGAAGGLGVLGGLGKAGLVTGSLAGPWGLAGAAGIGALGGLFG